MVFERRHINADKDTPIGQVGDVLGNISENIYNNTNASGYINRIRLKRKREELDMRRNNRDGQVFHNDPPPPGN